MKTLPQIFDNVWFMENNKPAQGTIDSITQTASRDNTKINTVIYINEPTTDSYKSITTTIGEVFNTKEELCNVVFNMLNTSLAEQCCIDVYNDYSKNEIKDLPPSIQHTWEQGEILILLGKVNNA